MHPYLIDLGRWQLPWLGEIHVALPTYGLLVASGVILAWIWMQRRAEREGIDAEASSRAAMWALGGGLLGGKLGLLAVEGSWFLAHPGDLLKADFLQAAGVIWTAVLGGLAGLLYAARSGRLPLGRLVDAAAPAIPMAQAIGRLGCLMAGCCFGNSCSAPWAVVYASVEARRRTGVPLGIPLHPAPLYEALGSLLLVLPVALWATARRRRPGEGAAAYLATYGTLRFGVEFFRGDTIRGLWLSGTLSTSQILSALIVPLAAGAWIWLHFRPAPQSAAAEASGIAPAPPGKKAGP
ncbi:MAG: prolipoprotein diacylglyceryl transferase [Acidobacteriota bacterium]|nr:prolipoprotein diacylglyceryl transferase [Acidobacteriota bacterium]MDQ7088845.1 prolipoprotein diacylglyceryl transferase [Acidobacteriota bacterium]